MTDLYDIPAEQRTRKDVRAYYYEKFPLLRAYEEVTEERNSVPSQDINDPASSPTAVDTVTAAALALTRVGRPARDREDALHAERYVRGIQQEMASMMPANPDESMLLELVISGVYGLAACVPDADSWAGFDTETQEFELDEILACAPDHTDALKALLREALEYGMSGVLREITARYGRGRRPLPVESDATARMPLAAAEALLREAAEGGPIPGDDEVAVSVEVLRTVMNIGLTDSRRTLEELQGRYSRGGRPELADRISAWEAAIAWLEDVAGPFSEPIPSRKREASDG